MRMLWASLAGMAFLIPATLVAGDVAVAPCKQRLSPIQAVAPKLPSRLHNEFEGTAWVAYIVDVDGRTRSPRIVSASWKPIGRSRGQPVGYAQAAVAAVEQWRFPPQAKPCRNLTPMEFTFDESLGSPAPHSGKSR